MLKYIFTILLISATALYGQTTSQNTERISSIETVIGNVLCGNGIVNPGASETCDDGNLINGDGCSSNCIIEQTTEESPSGLLINSEWDFIPNSSMRIGGIKYTSLTTLSTCEAESGYWTGSSCQLFNPAIDDQWDDYGQPRSFESIQTGWSGATCINNELVLMGGGHGDGAHNGVFAVDVNTGSWRRVTMPSPTWQARYINRPNYCPGGICTYPDGTTCEIKRCVYNPDGTPKARHTYDILASDGTDFFVFGGSIYPGGNAGYQPRGWKLTMSSGEWKPLPPSSTMRVAGSVQYVDGVFYQTAPSWRGALFDLINWTWITAKGTTASTHGYTQGVYVPITDRLYRFGDYTSWSVPRSELLGGEVRFHGIGPLGYADSRNSIGVTWYDPEELILLWDGGANIETFDPINETWGVLSLPGNTPGMTIKNGTNGRFDYCGGRIVLVNGVDTPLYYIRESQ